MSEGEREGVNKYVKVSCWLVGLLVCWSVG